MATKTTNAARISALEESNAAIWELLNKQTAAINAQTKILESLVNNQAAASQAAKPSKPAAKKNNTNKAKSNNKSNKEVENTGFHCEKRKAKNGNGEVYYIKFDKPCCDKQYLAFKCLDPDAFKKGVIKFTKRSLWSHVSGNVYRAFASEDAKKWVDYFEKNYKPATEEEIEHRRAVWAKYEKKNNK